MAVVGLFAGDQRRALQLLLLQRQRFLLLQFGQSAAKIVFQLADVPRVTIVLLIQPENLEKIEF